VISDPRLEILLIVNIHRFAVRGEIMERDKNVAEIMVFC
jgi:hypothetical protein